jgi:hypothetical protein
LRSFFVQEEKVLRNNKAYSMIDANKSGVRFHSKELKKLNPDFIKAKKEYNEIESNLIKDFADVAGETRLSDVKLNPPVDHSVLYSEKLLILIRSRRLWSSLHGLGRIGAISQATLN